MTWPAPVGGGLGAAFDVFLQHQALGEQFSGGRADGIDIGGLGGKAFQHGGTRIAAPYAFFRRVGERKVTAFRLMVMALFMETAKPGFVIFLMA